ALSDLIQSTFEQHSRHRQLHSFPTRRSSDLRSARGRAWYKKRKGMEEPVFGTLKEQRGMRQFQRRGKSATAVEWTLASVAHNLRSEEQRLNSSHVSISYAVFCLKQKLQQLFP